jgi:lipopolysaccharide/colanic/teichoic acid biosynthesis glycosyltransferase
MILRAWKDLPKDMQTPEVKKYYKILQRHKLSLILKRAFDIVASIILLIILVIPMLIIAVLIVTDTKGPVFFRQVRITTYGKEFRIHKFRTMYQAEYKGGSQVTVKNDSRVTKVGKVLRKYRLDEFPQLIDVLVGDMSFVGTRPEVPKYVEQYTNEMKATLLLPAGITSEASIRYKDEAELLDGAENVDKVYIEQVLPAKMKYNLKSIRHFSFLGDLMTMVRTVFAVLGKEY